MNILIEHMGDDFHQLYPLLQRFHTGKKRLTGTCCVQQGNVIAQLICTIFHFPKPARGTELIVDCQHSEKAMSWNRNFNGLKMQSKFSERGEFLVEHLNGLTLYFKAVERNGSLHYEFYKTRLLGIPLPKFLSPQVIAYESVSDGDYCFVVQVHMWLIGMVISYWGRMQMQELS